MVKEKVGVCRIYLWLLFQHEKKAIMKLRYLSKLLIIIVSDVKKLFVRVGLQVVGQSI